MSIDIQQIIDFVFRLFKNYTYPIMWYAVLYGMLTPKYSRLLCIVLPAAVNIAVSYLLVSSGMNVALRTFCLLILFAVPALLLYSDELKRRIGAAIVLELVVLLTDISIAGMVFLIYGEDGPTFDVPLTWRSVIDQIAIVITSAAVYFGFLSLWRRRIKHISSKKMMLFYLFPFGQILFIMSFILKYENFEEVFDTPYSYAAIAVSIVTDFVMFRALRDEDILEATKQQIDIQLKYYDSLTRQYDEIRKYRHDISNLVAAAQTLIGGEVSPGEGKALVEDLITVAGEMKISYFCDDPMVNAMIWQKENEAKSLGISFDVNIDISGEFPLGRIEKCSVFANLLDNAINGAANCEEGERFVSLSAKLGQGMLVIVVENSSVYTFDSENRTSSEIIVNRKGFHGQGIEILRGIAKKHGGKFTVKARDAKARAVFAILDETKNDS